MYGIRPCAPELAVAIERESHKTVTRKELRPLDWKAIWPELDDKDSKPARSAAKHPAQRASDRSPRHPKAAA